jgi:hypothetical protein
MVTKEDVDKARVAFEKALAAGWEVVFIASTTKVEAAIRATKSARKKYTKLKEEYQNGN